MSSARWRPLCFCFNFLSQSLMECLGIWLPVLVAVFGHWFSTKSLAQYHDLSYSCFDVYQHQPHQLALNHGHHHIGPLYVTSSYSTWIFCRGVSGFASDCPCDVWCRGLTTCLLHVGPPFGNRFLNTNWAVGLTYWIVYLHFLYFDKCNYKCLDTSYHFLALSLLLKYSLFFQVLLY